LGEHIRKVGSLKTGRRSLGCRLEFSGLVTVPPTGEVLASSRCLQIGLGRYSIVCGAENLESFRG
jgi:hypothetical protein